jgi:hypothetical protein
MKFSWNWLRARIACWRGRHKYLPAYQVRTLVTSNAGHVRKEFSYECCCCQASTKWLRWSKHKEFVKQHQPSWNNGVFARPVEGLDY